MHKLHAALFCAAALALGLLASPTKAEPLRVVVSIKPLHSLVSMVLDGIAEPYLIVKGASSPHGHALRPSDAKALADAHAVFWIGPNLETFMVKPLESLPVSARVVALMDRGAHSGHVHSGVKDAANKGTDAHTHEYKDSTDRAHEHGHEHEHEHGDVDPHIWLSPQHAVEIIEHVAATVSDIVPAAADRVSANRDRAIEELIDVDAEVRRLIKPMHDEYLVTLHEAYTHFTNHYGLRDFIALSVTPEHKPTPGRISEVRRMINEYFVRCVFAEPQFPDTYVRLLTEGTRAQADVIDPLGARLRPGPDLYPQLIRLMGFAIRGCYEETS
ncbi:MAG: zinc ABC transporter substrate-binding protein [Rhodospirillales bacterium]|nr:zinc ABC transporter substrate-binding protein [Rhodospirillales bacterium]